jgi:hypothetical protein
LPFFDIEKIDKNKILKTLEVDVTSIIKIKKQKLEYYNDSFFIQKGIGIRYGSIYNMKKENKRKIFSPQLILFISILWDVYPKKDVNLFHLISDYEIDIINKDKNNYPYFFEDYDDNDTNIEIRYFNGSKKLMIDYGLYKKKFENLFDEVIHKIINYDKNNENNKFWMIIVEKLKSIHFEKQNPMKQLTGTFNPQKIDDIEKWYRIGNFYDNEKKRKLVHNSDDNKNIDIKN